MPPKTKIFVGKLPPTVKDFELKKLFETYGEVTECSILGNYAFVHMKTEDVAESAINGLNNYDLHGSKISVEQSTGEKRSGGGGGGMGGGMRGGRGGMFRGRGGPMRGRGMPRPGPYDRRNPMDDRYGYPGPHPGAMRNGYYDDYERRDRRPMPAPMDRRPPMPPRDPYRDSYDRYDGYDHMAPPMRRTPPMERRPPPVGYDRRDDHYGEMYGRPGERDMYGSREMYGRGRSPPRRSPPRREGYGNYRWLTSIG